MASPWAAAIPAVCHVESVYVLGKVVYLKNHILFRPLRKWGKSVLFFDRAKAAVEKRVGDRYNEKIEFQILQHIHAVLTQSGIPCFLDGGTLLGAVRHKGIVP